MENIHHETNTSALDVPEMPQAVVAKAVQEAMASLERAKVSQMTITAAFDGGICVMLNGSPAFFALSLARTLEQVASLRG